MPPVKSMINFKRIELSDKPLYDSYLKNESDRGCEFSFANLYLWGRQNFTEIHGHIVIFSQFNRQSVYPYPLGTGDKKAVLDAIIEDSKARGIPCRITGVSEEEFRLIDKLYPNQFRFHCDMGAFDYVYSIDDLADLAGKKYHSKRNHLKRFYESYPNFRVEPLGDGNIEKAKQMVAEWYEEKLAENPNSDFYMEQVAIDHAFRDYKALEMDGLVLFDGDNVLALTLGCKLSDDTFDVNFEKARAGVNGAYAAINNEFAKYLREKYPEIKFIDREEDMGIEGLRKAKKSYYPHHMIEKCWACLLEDGYDY